MKRKRLTPKQRVLRKWPKAYSSYNPYMLRWNVGERAHKDHHWYGSADTARGAWADAARRLPRGH
jgi:hypothetical protein